MRAAWTLLYSRRYCSRRSDPEPDPGSSSRGSDCRHDKGGSSPRREDQDSRCDSPSSPDNPRREDQNPHRGERKDQDPNHGSPSRHDNPRREDQDPHRSSPSHRTLRDPEPIQLERTNSQFRSAIGNSAAAASREDSWTRIIRTHPFPAPVEEARQRLGDFSLAEHREVVVDPSIFWDRIALYHRSTMPDTRGREPVLLRRIGPVLSYEKTPCLNLEAQQHEVFRNSEEGTESTKGLLECCICLEKLQEGDELIVLNCAHRFHKTCLEPWVLTSGNCPYCRASIA